MFKNYKRWPWFVWVAIALGAWFLIKYVKNFVGFGKTLRGTMQGDAAAQAIETALSHDVNPDRANAIVQVAQDIHDAFHKDSWFGMFEDEEKAVSAFNSLQTPDEAMACAMIYRMTFTKGLYTELHQYCNGSDWSALNDVYLNVIKNK